jgi:DNA replication protein DnaC
MISEKSIRLINEIKLPEIAHIVEMQEELEVYKTMTFAERMDHLISELYQRKMDTKYKGLLSRAHLRYREADISNIVYNNRGFTRDDIITVLEPSYIRKGNSIVFQGPVGSGKTYLACALANSIGILRGYRTLYLRCPEFTEKISALEPLEFRKYIKRLAAFQILILDEWLTHPLTQDQAAALLELLELRERLEVSTFFCTLYPKEIWLDHLGGGVIAESCMERIVYATKFISCGSQNMRAQFKNN